MGDKIGIVLVTTALAALMLSVLFASVKVLTLYLNGQL